jgi:protein-tyrosine phosphatase
MAEALLRAAVAGTGLSEQVVVDSAGTHGFHVGGPADRRTTAALAEIGEHLDHRARQFRPEWLEQRDLILAMDTGHLRDLVRLARRNRSPSEHIRLIRDFDPRGTGDVPDPYYDTIEQFRQVREMLQRTMPSLVDHLRALAASH